MDNKKKKTLPKRKRLAALFTSFSIVIMGALSLSRSMSLDYYTVMGTLYKVLPASFAMGCLGWVMGMILDKPKKRNLGFNNMFLNEIMKNSGISDQLKDDDSGGDISEEIAEDAITEPEA